MDPLLLVSIIVLVFGALCAAFLCCHPISGKHPLGILVFLGFGLIMGDLLNVALIPSLVFLVGTLALSGYFRYRTYKKETEEMEQKMKELFRMIEESP